jgi:SAM-dependent methyltransferase
MPDPATDKPELEVVGASYAAAMDRIAAQATGPVLQIGSRASVIDLKAANWRNRLSRLPFVGLDMAPGDNVDVVADIAGEFRALRDRLKTFQFGTIICAHVLEHVRQPWIAARNIERLLVPGGLLFIQVPWVQAYHPFPEDYWRFSFSGIKSLFEDVHFEDAYYSGGSSDRIYTVRRRGEPVLGGDAAAVEAKLFQVLLPPDENTRFINNLGEAKLNLSRGYMPVMVVNLVGRKSNKSK